jgi:hypothetical protein
MAMKERPERAMMAPMKSENHDPVVGNPQATTPDDVASQIMSAMVRMPPEPHKAAPKPTTRKGEAQRRRREREHQKTMTSPNAS